MIVAQRLLSALGLVIVIGGNLPHNPAKDVNAKLLKADVNHLEDQLRTDNASGAITNQLLERQIQFSHSIEEVLNLSAVLEILIAQYIVIKEHLICELRLKGELISVNTRLNLEVFIPRQNITKAELILDAQLK